MNPIQDIKESLSAAITEGLVLARDKGLMAFKQIPQFIMEVPREKGHGDFACNVAMLMAKEARMAPRQIADLILAQIEVENISYVDKIEVAGAGFINIFCNNEWLYKTPAVICAMGDKYGYNQKKDIKVQVEFVSANPTGDLHMGNARGGAIGDTLANILEYAGYQVGREFYINDAGNQIDIFADSLEARYFQLNGQDVQFPDNGYAGQDVVQTVERIIAKYNDKLISLDPENRRKILLEFALEEKINYIEKTLEKFGVNYDVWFSEKSLHDRGKIEEAMQNLEQNGYIYEKDGARWFKATLFGDEKDEVLMRTNGVPTYFAADIAYHQDKFERGFDWVINVWGADHHGHINRMKGAIKALGHNPEKLDILLMQLVRLYRGKEIIRMSKRTGTTVSLDELIEEVGKDAARFFFVMRSPESHLDFDLELARQKSQENPVYYVQYAHARIMSIFRQAKAAGVEMAANAEIEVELLSTPEELNLLRKIADFPEEIATAAATLAPHRIARYVLDLAGLFHSFYNRHKVLNDDKGLQDARLLLVNITGITIKNSLEIIGVSAPEFM